VDRPQHLRTFHLVCRTGSFAVAARELGYTSSAVSQQIAALERDTGLVLFERQAHGVRPTAVAHRLVELSRPVLASLDELEHQVHRLATGATGRIRLGSFPTASVRLVPPVLSAFTAEHPGAEVSLVEEEPEDLVERLVDGRLDVALLYEYGLCPRQWPAGVATRPLVYEDLLLLQPADGPQAARLTQLAQRRWITSRDGTDGALSLARLCAAAGFTPSIAYRSNDYDVVRELVAATGGVAVVPALGHAPDPRVAAGRLPQRGAHRAVLVAHRASPNPLLADFLSVVRRAAPAVTAPFVAVWTAPTLAATTSPTARS
jgi:DNA-binding transcriptional LysR family regulator